MRKKYHIITSLFETPDQKYGYVLAHTAQVYGQAKEVVIKDLIVKTPAGGSLAVPRGFETDLASTPRIVWSFLPPNGVYKSAAIVHDWLYYSGTGTQKYADDMFLYLMRDSGVFWLKRFFLWAGLRLGGWIAYKEHRMNDRSKEKKRLCEIADQASIDFSRRHKSKHMP